MRVTEGKKIVEKKYLLELNEQDIELLLKAIGKYQQLQWDSGFTTRWTEKLIDKIYKSMGVKL